MTTKVSLPELKSLCKENNIKGYSKLKKDEIIDLLNKNKIEIKDPKRKEDVEKLTEDLKELDVKEKKPKKSEIKKDESEDLDDKMKDPITKYYIFKDEKSDKFWEIIYDNTSEEKIKYIVRYGKVNTPGSRSKPKMDTMKNIEKLIETKTKKGYKQDI